MLNEVVDVHEAAANSHLQAVAFLDLDIDTFLSKAIDALRLSQEQDLHFFLFRVRVDEVCKCFLDDVALLGDVCKKQLLHVLLRNQELSSNTIQFLFHVLQLLVEVAEVALELILVQLVLLEFVILISHRCVKVVDRRLHRANLTLKESVLAVFHGDLVAELEYVFLSVLICLLLLSEFLP